MDFKIHIECIKCQCSFELRPHEFKSRTSMECPNCGQAFPESVYNNLKSGVIALGSVPDHVNEDDTTPFSDLLFTVRVKNYGYMHDYYDKSKN